MGGKDIGFSGSSGIERVGGDSTDALTAGPIMFLTCRKSLPPPKTECCASDAGWRGGPPELSAGGMVFGEPVVKVVAPDVLSYGIILATVLGYT